MVQKQKAGYQNGNDQKKQGQILKGMEEEKKEGPYDNKDHSSDLGMILRYKHQKD